MVNAQSRDQVVNFGPLDGLLSQLAARNELLGFLTSETFLVHLRDALAMKASSSRYFQEEYDRALDLFNRAYPQHALEKFPC